MPLGFGRNFQGMVATVPGASRPFRPHSEFFNSQDSLSSNVNGQSRLANNVQIEGVDNNHRTGLLTVLIPSAEALETVSVTTSNYDAEFGRAGGAVTNVTLKSGTNQFKGSGVLLRQHRGDASPPTRSSIARCPRSGRRPKTAYHQGGFTLGGPIIRNRLFFFGDYIRTSDDLGRINRYTIPTEAMRNGDFSASSVPIFDPLTGDPATGADRTQFPGNRDSGRPHQPDRPPASWPTCRCRTSPARRSGQINYQDATVRERRTDGFDVKFNYQLSPKDQLSVRYSFQRPTVFEPGNYADGVFGGPYQGGFVGTGVNKTQSAAGNWTRTLTNTLVMDAALRRQHLPQRGAQRRQRPEHGDRSRHSRRQPRHLHERHDDHQPAGLLEPDRRASSTSLPWNRGETTYTAAVTMTKLWGNHTIKFGGDYRHNSDYLLQTQDQGGPRGFFTFNGGQTGVPSHRRVAEQRRQLDGRVPARSAEHRRPRPRGHRQAGHGLLGGVHLHPRQVAGLAEDDARPRACGTSTTRRSSASSVRAACRTTIRSPTSCRSPATASVPDNLGVKSTWRNFNPRTGLSYRIDDRQVVRAGYGVEHDPVRRQHLRLQLPGQAEQPVQRRQRLHPAARRCRWRRASRRRSWRRSRRTASSTPAPIRGCATAPTSTSRPT